VRHVIAHSRKYIDESDAEWWGEGIEGRSRAEARGEGEKKRERDEVWKDMGRKRSVHTPV